MQILSTTKSASTQSAVLSSTYQLLGLSLIPTVIGAAIGSSLNLSFLVASPIIGSLAMFFAMMGLMWLVSANRNSSAGVAFLFLFTFVAGLFLGPILQAALSLANGSQLIGLAAAGTGISFITLSAIGASTKRDLSSFGKFLTIGLIALIIVSLANLFFQLSAVSLTISALSIIVFGGLMVYDINRIVTGGETNYIMATLSVYLNVYNMFSAVLRLLMATSSSD